MFSSEEETNIVYEESDDDSSESKPSQFDDEILSSSSTHKYASTTCQVAVGNRNFDDEVINSPTTGRVMLSTSYFINIPVMFELLLCFLRLWVQNVLFQQKTGVKNNFPFIIP